LTVSNEPKILSRGKEFHKRVQQDWEREADGLVSCDRTIHLLGASYSTARKRSGRMDIFVYELDGSVSIVEIISTDWDRIKKQNRHHLLASHCRRVWKFIETVTGECDFGVCAGIIYPKHPQSPGLKEEIEEYLNDYGIQILWYDS